MKHLIYLFSFVLCLSLVPLLTFAAEFVPLTQIPGISDIANSSTLPAFLNNIYQICIGAAAVLAVLQIMRGGLTYMLGDSITEKKEARSLIVMSIVGLLLVLSPAIVFGIIDPRILNLQLNFTPLAPAAGTGVGTQGQDQGSGGEDQDGDSNDGGAATSEEGPCPAGEEEVLDGDDTVDCEPVFTGDGAGVPQPVSFYIGPGEGDKRIVKATYVSGTPHGATTACNFIELQQDYFNLNQCPTSTPSPYHVILPCQEVTGLPKVLTGSVPAPRCSQPDFDIR